MSLTRIDAVPVPAKKCAEMLQQCLSMEYPRQLLNYAKRHCYWNTLAKISVAISRTW